MDELSGVVKSWNGAKGYGFINCDQVVGDVFFSRNELPKEAREVRGTFLEGRSVTFEAMEGSDGRVKASSVHIPAIEGQPLAGVVKSYSEQNRYGFLQSSSLSEDVRFHSNDLPLMPPGANLKGKLVTFEMQQLPDGKLRVVQMQFQTSRIAASVTACGGAHAGAAAGYGGGLAALPAPPVMLPVQQHHHPVAGALTGSVKSYSDRHGYGFINMPGQVIDIKFGKADLLVDTISAGAFVSFVPVTSADGRVQARQVQLATAKRVASPAHAATVQNGFHGRPLKQQRTVPGSKPAAGGLAPGQTLRGVVKSYIPGKGFGFINSAWVDGDIYFGRQLLPSEEQSSELKGRAVNFEVSYTADGKLRAQSVSMV